MYLHFGHTGLLDLIGMPPNIPEHYAVSLVAQAHRYQQRASLPHLHWLLHLAQRAYGCPALQVGSRGHSRCKAPLRSLLSSPGRRPQHNIAGRETRCSTHNCQQYTVLRSQQSLLQTTLLLAAYVHIREIILITARQLSTRQRGSRSKLTSGNDATDRTHSVEWPG